MKFVQNNNKFGDSNAENAEEDAENTFKTLAVPSVQLVLVWFWFSLRLSLRSLRSLR
jgi:hypothetical protein